MSNKVTYIFVAEDKFTSVANKIANSIQNINDKLNGVNKEAKTFSSNFSNLGVKITSLKKALDEYSKSAKKAAEKTSKFREKTKGLVHVSEKFIKAADQFGMSAYFQLMNIEFPMAILVKLGSDYADAMDSAALSMEFIFQKTKGHLAFQKQMVQMAEKIEKMGGGISAAQVMQVSAIVSARTNNMAAVKQAVPAILEYAIGTGQKRDISGAARQFMAGVLSGKLPRANILLTGGSPFQRLQQAINETHKRFRGILEKDAESSSSKLAALSVQVSHLASVIFTQMGPALELALNDIKKLTNFMIPFVQQHKTLITILGKAAFYVTGFLVSLVALGAVAGALVMPFHLLKFAIAGINIALEMNPIVRAITLLGILAATLWEVAGGIEGIKKSMGGMWGRLSHPLETLMKAPVNPLSYFSDIEKAGGVDNYNKIHMTINVKDKGEHVGSVHAKNEGTIPMVVNLGRNMR